MIGPGTSEESGVSRPHDVERDGPVATIDKRIDAYIDNARPFAIPILRKLRKWVHAGCPEVVETLKWSCPSFEYKGILCGMAAFKADCTFGFWKHDLLGGEGAGLTKVEESAMGQFGRITNLAQLPKERAMIGLVRKAAALNEAGIRAPARKRAAANRPRRLQVPTYFAKALEANRKAKETFSGFSYSHRKEYVEWIVEAKQEATRERRMKQALAWLAEGKSRNWKYERC